MTGEDGMMTTVTNPWDISAKDVSAAARQQACLYDVACLLTTPLPPFVGSEPWRLISDYLGLWGSPEKCISVHFEP